MACWWAALVWTRARSSLRKKGCRAYQSCYNRVLDDRNFLVASIGFLRDDLPEIAYRPHPRPLLDDRPRIPFRQPTRPRPGRRRPQPQHRSDDPVLKSGQTRTLIRGNRANLLHPKNSIQPSSPLAFWVKANSSHTMLADFLLISCLRMIKSMPGIPESK